MMRIKLVLIGQGFEVGLDGKSNGGRGCIGIVLCLIHGSNGTMVANTWLGGW